MHLFNRSLHQKRRDKAAATLGEVDFVLRESADRLADRLEDIQRTFPLALDLGCHTGQFSSPKIDALIQSDFSQKMVEMIPLPPSECEARSVGHPLGSGGEYPQSKRIVADDEYLPFADSSLDAVISNLSLHWVNDLVGCLIQIRRALKADGLFLAVVPGPRTLQELRESLLAVSVAQGKIAPRISPFVEVRDAGALLQRAGFALPVVDSETLTLTYRDPLTLLRELRQMGEANALTQQHQGLTGKNFWPQVMQHYAEHFSDLQGRLSLTVELVFMTAWKPHDSQQQPAKRGSGQVNLTTVFNKG
jgi:SAM-dependent methyltransferase